MKISSPARNNRRPAENSRRPAERAENFVARRAQRTFLATLAFAACLWSTGCAHAVRIESTPGAEILVDGKSVGQSPATYHETTGMSGSVQVTARHKGKTKTITVPRTQVDMGAIGAGFGAGAGVCAAGMAATAVSSIIFLPCGIMVGALSWCGFAAGPITSYLLFSHKMPDHVKIDLNVPDAVASAPREDEQAPAWANKDQLAAASPQGY